MHPFGIDVLFLPGLAILAATIAVSALATRSPSFSSAAGLIKAGIFLVYFGLIFDGTYYFADDFEYLIGAEELLGREVGITTLYTDWLYILSVTNSQHFLYHLHNVYAFRFFGIGYYAPVALNILLTLPIAFFGARLAVKEFGLSESSGKWFFGFLLLHPDIVAWSSVLNGKDTAVLLLHVLTLYAVSLFFSGRQWAAMFLGAAATTMLLFLRFYVPFLFAVAFIVTVAGRLRYMVLGGLVLAAVTMSLEEGVFDYAMESLAGSFTNPFYGLVHFLLTPIPFGTSANYEFIEVPAMLNWLLLPFAFYGVCTVYRRHTLFSRYFLCYVLTFLALYSVYAELQGPRHRVELDYAIALFQFFGLRALLRSALNVRTSAAH